MKAKALMKKAEAEGWTLKRVIGSHHQYVKNGVTCTIPGPKNNEIPGGTVRSILNTLKEGEDKEDEDQQRA